MRILLLRTMLISLTIAGVLATSTLSNGAPARISFASLPSGTSNNAMANALAKIATEHSGILVVTKPGSSASAWISSTHSRGNPELGFAHILDVWWGYSGKLSPTPLEGEPYGTKPFYAASPNLRMLMAGPRQRVGCLIRDDRPWQSLTEAKGQNLAGGFSAHAGAYSGLVAALMAEELSENKDFKLVPVASVAASVTALSEGRAEIALASVGLASVAEANSKMPVRFLDVPADPKSRARVSQAFPGSSVELYTGRGPGLNRDTWLITYPMIVTASTHMDEDTAYTLIKSWWEHYGDAAKMHAGFSDWDNSQFVIRNATIPYHAGAIRFYREQGVWDEEMDAIQDALLQGQYPFLSAH